MKYIFFLSLIAFTSFLFTELIRCYTLNKKIIDIPNDRSSHTIPTPRGGGLAIVVIFFISLSFIVPLSEDIFFALVGAGLLIAGVGFWDDHNHIPAKWRLLAHFTASFWVLFWLGGVTQLHIFNYSINPGFIGLLLVAFLLVWLLNLFNFMDGIDGITASETIFVTCAGAFFSWLSGLESMALIALILAASTTGFLIINWPPAKIFMGDVGSGFIGMMLGVIAYANILEGVSVWIWIILFAVFLVDSGITLLKRIYLKEKWYEAHCSHAYQHAARKWGHKSVTLTIILINMLWLFPSAYLVYLKPDFAIMILLTAYLPLVILALKLKAGTTYAKTIHN